MTDLSDEIQEINLEGFQVVSGDLFTNYTRPIRANIRKVQDYISV